MNNGNAGEPAECIGTCRRVGDNGDASSCVGMEKCFSFPLLISMLGPVAIDALAVSSISFSLFRRRFRRARTKAPIISPKSSRPPSPAPTPMPALAPVLRPESSSAQGSPRAKTWLMMTVAARAVVVSVTVSATSELIDASTVGGIEIAEERAL